MGERYGFLDKAWQVTKDLVERVATSIREKEKEVRQSKVKVELMSDDELIRIANSNNVLEVWRSRGALLFES